VAVKAEGEAVAGIDEVVGGCDGELGLDLVAGGVVAAVGGVADLAGGEVVEDLDGRGAEGQSDGELLADGIGVGLGGDAAGEKGAGEEATGEEGGRWQAGWGSLHGDKHITFWPGRDAAVGLRKLDEAQAAWSCVGCGDGWVGGSDSGPVGEGGSAGVVLPRGFEQQGAKGHSPLTLLSYR
jgi:hypothetical protein